MSRATPDAAASGPVTAAVAEAFLANSNDLMVLFAGDGTIRWASPSAERIFGVPPDDLVGHNGFAMIHPDDQERAFEAFAGMAGFGDQARIEIRIVAPSGQVRWVEEVATNLLAAPEVESVVGHLRDITERRAAEEAVRAQAHLIEEDRRRMADAQASAHLGSFELDLRTGDLVGSDELWRILGREPCGLRQLEHIHPDDLDEFRPALRAAADGCDDVACTHRIVRPDGVVRWVVSRSSQFNHADSTILAGTMLDITERHEAEQALLHQATHDPLTGLANRTLFVERLEASLGRDRGDDSRTVVLFIDLDDFKVVNDRLGHVDADQVLRRLGERIVAAVQPSGTVGRLGGDEFVVFVDGVADLDDALAVVERVHAAIRAPGAAGDMSLLVDASIGVALGSTERRAEALLRNADIAMYAAKQAGGGRAEVFDDALHDRDRRRAELAGEAQAALEAGDIVTYFQPEVDLATGALFGFEALARWQHPDRGMIAPDEFIPLAEETGLIGILGRQMLDNACHALARWGERRPHLVLNVGVNVSPLQLADPTFPDQVRQAIEASGIDPGRLCLEVTESTLMDVQVAALALRRLRALGVTIAIDDFGTGYSSFGRLKQLSVDFLKIDQSFVADIGRPEDDVIVTTMAGLARSLGVTVIAEGIETERQHRFLAALGCQYGQGYLWSRPLTEADATALVDARPTVRR